MRILLPLALTLASCASEQKKIAPEWTRQPTRVVDGGYVVYVGSAAAPSADRASFKAEGVALEDLANECSLLPKGTRVEDRYSESGAHEAVAYVKVAVEFQDCERGRAALTPDAIRTVANVPFTAQLKRYQDLMETGELPAAGAVPLVEPSVASEPAPTRDARVSEETHFYVTRQYVTYQKELVVLSPPDAYASGSPESKRFVSAIGEPARQLVVMEKANPAWKSAPRPWSHLTERPELPRPAGLRRASRPAELHAPSTSPTAPTTRKGPHRPRPDKRVRKHH